MQAMRQAVAADGGAGPAEPSATPLVVGWVLAGSAALAGLFVVAGTSGPLGAMFLLVLGLIATAETAVVKFRVGNGEMSLTLIEAVVVIGLLTLPPAVVAVAVLGGVTVAQVLRRLPPAKAVFNLGQHAVAVTAAVTIVSMVPATPVVSSTRLAVAVAAALLYSLVNAAAVAGVFARLGPTTFAEELFYRPGFLVGTSVGNASIGALVIALWSFDPALIWLIVGPASALYLSYGSSVRVELLLGQVSGERDRLDRVVSGVQEGIVLLDADGTVRLWNRAMVHITGVATDDAVGQPAGAVLDSRDADGVRVDPVGPLQSRTPTATHTVQLTDRAGEVVDTRIVHTLVDDDRGRLVGDVVVVQDLSREREAHALKEDFVARVSHELRTPLSPLRGYAQIMLRAGDRIPPDKRDEIMNTMVERVGHLERLIDDLLLVSKVASGEATTADEVSCEVTDVAEIAGRMAEWVRRDHADRDLRVTVTDGARDGGAAAWADPLRVSQVVTNLVKNACKYATPGTPVDIEVDRSGDLVSVAIRDHGPGIPEDKLEAIFDRFQRLEDPQRMKTSGLGLGLYIARHLTTAMDGQLDVASQRGTGSTFTVTLPAASDEQVVAARTAPAATAAGGSRVHRRPDTLPAGPVAAQG